MRRAGASARLPQPTLTGVIGEPHSTLLVLEFLRDFRFRQRTTVRADNRIAVTERHDHPRQRFG